MILPLCLLALAQTSDPDWSAARIEHDGVALEARVSERPFPGGWSGAPDVPADWRPEPDEGPGRVTVPWKQVGAGWIPASERGRPGVVANLFERDGHRIVVGGPVDGLAPAGRAWTVELGPVPRLDRPGAQLLGPGPVPVFAQSMHGPLAVLGDAFLVSTGERGALVLLDANTGEERRRLEAPWEFERGYMGPSVWSVTLERFGADPVDKTPSGEARATFEARCTGWMQGFVVAGDDRVFVPLSRATPGPWERQRADGFVLELDETLRPLTLTQLPRPVRPRLARVVRDGERPGVVWALDDGGFVRIDSVPKRVAIVSMGPGGHDRRGDLRWIAAGSPAAAAAFMSMDRAADPVGFSATHAYRTPAGGRVPLDQRNELRMPVDRVSLATGSVQRLEVVLPLSGAPGAPETNYRFDGTTYSLWGHRIGGLTRILCSAEGELSLTIAAPGGAGAAYLQVEPEVLARLP